MFPISSELKVRNNLLDSYFPLRNKGNEFDWDKVTGLVLSHAFKSQVSKYEFEAFREDCKRRLMTSLESPEFWEVLDRIYFENQDIFKFSPLFLLFNAQFASMGKSKLGPANWRLGTLFTSLLANFSISTPPQDRLNFIEQEMLDVLKAKIEPLTQNPFGEEQPYLPYLAEAFQRDMHFLAAHPNYLLQELGNTLKLYAFSYCSQLALNVRTWRDGEPKSKPLYFILDTEKASLERYKIQHDGYKKFAAMSVFLFPVLSALEVLQVGDKKRPLWQIYSDVENSSEKDEVFIRLKKYVEDFTADRRLRMRTSPENIEQVFRQIEEVAIEQFEDSKTERASVNKKYVKELEDKICSDFIQSRGRSGRVLVLNQDYLFLMTNLAIGVRPKLRLHELLIEFEQRGFYVDNQTKQALVAFYERMGNVERMSDSGDAVYVLKTV
jgi:DNA phosphorothioation-dependent restriction protein DptG